MLLCWQAGRQAMSGQTLHRMASQCTAFCRSSATMVRWYRSWNLASDGRLTLEACFVD